MNLHSIVTNVGLSVAVAALVLIPGLSVAPMHHQTAAAITPPATHVLTTTTSSTNAWGVNIVAFNSQDMGANKPYIYNALQQTNQYAPGHLKTLFGANATKHNILAAIDWLAANAKSTDTIIFSDNSHGYYQNGASGIVPVDYTSGGLISVQELASHLNNIHAKAMFILVDCCFAGNFISGARPQQAPSLLSQGLEGQNRIVLMSTLRGGLGIGITIRDGQGEQYLSFTRYVAEGINKHYDPNHDGIVSGEEVYRYAKSRWMPLALGYTLSVKWQSQTYRQSGHIALPLPRIYDTAGVFPLAQAS